MSPALHNRGFDVCDLDFVYVAFRVEAGNVRAALEGMRALENFRGLSVTIPHKTAAVECVDDISKVDAAIGSINTIINENGRLRGLGSDGPGARKALLDSDLDPTGRTVTILGTGGASRAIAFDLVHHTPPERLILCGIVKEELETLALNVADTTAVPVESILIEDAALKAAVLKSELLINTTPVGMHPQTDATPVPESFLHKDLGIMDIVYNPLQTRLLREGAALGVKTVSGLEMFVNQAVIQFEAWTGHTAPREAMRDIVLQKIK